MKSIFKLLALSGTLCLTLTSCSEEEATADFNIECISHTFIVNDCTTYQNYTGSSIDISMCINKQDVEKIKHVKVWTKFSSGDTGFEGNLIANTHYLYRNDSTEIFIPWCVYFDNSSSTTHTYQIETIDDKKTKKITLQIPRPNGAN